MKNKFRIFSLISITVLDWLSLTTFLILKKYDILPLKYFLPIILVLLLTSGLFSLLIIKKKTKKKKISNKIKIPITILSILESLVLVFVLIYLNKTFKFLDNIGDSGYHIENYSVIVLKNRYTDIKELEAKTISYYKQENSTVDQALEKLDEVISSIKEENNNYQTMVDKLYNEETDAMMIEESHRSMIEEKNPDFKDKTEVIYKIEIKTQTESIVKNVNVNKEPFNIYISGIDTYGTIDSVSRSDVNIVATINPKTHQVLLTSIPRDYYVDLADTGSKDKLTHAGIYGIDKSIKTIENLLDTEINYYVKVNFSSVQNIIDALGGVEVYSEYSFNGYDGTIFQQGFNKVNGTQALDFARTRKTVPGGDRTRGQNQQALISAMIEKACSKEILTKYTSLLKSLEGSFQTNMSTDEITSLIKNQIREMAKWNVTSVNLDGYDGSGYTYSYSWELLYVMIPDDDSVLDAQQKIKEVLAGETLESSYAENTGNVNIPGKGTPQWMYEYGPSQEIVQVEEPTTPEQPIEIEEPEDPEITEEPTEIEEPTPTEEPTTPEQPIEIEEPIENPDENQELVQGTNEKSETTIE